MPDTTTTDLAALEAEIDALIAAGAEQDARVEALLARPIERVVTTRERIDALWAGVTELAAASAEIERQQAEISAALDALEQDA
jgi:serine phosphatase RsbU (regulator of sigma subunit)